MTSLGLGQLLKAFREVVVTQLGMVMPVSKITWIGQAGIETDAAPCLPVADFHTDYCRAANKCMLPDGGNGIGHAVVGDG